jgi:hypothetical protein
MRAYCRDWLSLRVGQATRPQRGPVRAWPGLRADAPSSNALPTSSSDRLRICEGSSDSSQNARPDAYHPFKSCHRSVRQRIPPQPRLRPSALRNRMPRRCSPDAPSRRAGWLARTAIAPRYHHPCPCRVHCLPFRSCRPMQVRPDGGGRLPAGRRPAIRLDRPRPTAGPADTRGGLGAGVESVARTSSSV